MKSLSLLWKLLRSCCHLFLQKDFSREGIRSTLTEVRNAISVIQSIPQLDPNGSVLGKFVAFQKELENDYQRRFVTRNEIMYGRFLN